MKALDASLTQDLASWDWSRMGESLGCWAALDKFASDSKS